jgi:hypothetical protein
VPKDHTGRQLKGAARDMYIQRQADIAEALAARQAVESVARGVMVAFSKLTGLSGPDATRAIMGAALGADGTTDALNIVRAAGHSVPAQAAAWRADAPVRRQASRGADWSTDPDHSPAVMAAISSGASMEEVARQRHLAAAQHQAARAGQQKQSGLMWELRGGGQLFDGSGDMPPQQRSVVQREWHEFPDHQPQRQPAPEQVAPAGQPSIWSER